jgi:hypothetical protein
MGMISLFIPAWGSLSSAGVIVNVPSAAIEWMVRYALAV